MVVEVPLRHNLDLESSLRLPTGVDPALELADTVDVGKSTKLLYIIRKLLLDIRLLYGTINSSPPVPMMALAPVLEVAKATSKLAV